MNLFVAVLSDGFGFDPNAEAAIGGISSTEEQGLQLCDPSMQLLVGVKVFIYQLLQKCKGAHISVITENYLSLHITHTYGTHISLL